MQSAIPLSTYPRLILGQSGPFQRGYEPPPALSFLEDAYGSPSVEGAKDYRYVCLVRALDDSIGG